MIVVDEVENSTVESIELEQADEEAGREGAGKLSGTAI